MRGYRVSQATANEAALEGLEVYISRHGEYIRSDNVDKDRIGKFLVSPIQEVNIPTDAFPGQVGIHFDPGEESIAFLAEVTGLSYIALVTAARQGRLEARQSGRIWLSTAKAVEDAIKAGRLRGTS